MQRHHLEVVLVRADTEVRRAAKRLAWLEVVGNKQVSGWVGKLDHDFKKKLWTGNAAWPSQSAWPSFVNRQFWPVEPKPPQRWMVKANSLAFFRWRRSW